MKPSNDNSLFKLLGIFLLMFTCVSIAAEPNRVLVSIKPIHSLVSAVMHGVAEPELLMKTNQSLHHYNMRPSERRLIAQASLLFWVGPELETFLPRVLDNPRVTVKSIALINTQDLIKLKSIEKHEHESHIDTEHPDNQLGEKDLQTDPHIWLSTENAKILTREITKQLVVFDPTHKIQYESNRDKLIQQINQLKQRLNKQTDPLKKPYMTFHNAIRYFEQEFGLNNIASIQPNSEVQPGIAHIQQITHLITDNKISCLFYNQPQKPALIKSLESKHKLSAYALDPVGIYIKAGTETWFDIMLDVSKNLSACLNSRS